MATCPTTATRMLCEPAHCIRMQAVRAGWNPLGSNGSKLGARLFPANN